MVVIPCVNSAPNISWIQTWFVRAWRRLRGMSMRNCRGTATKKKIYNVRRIPPPRICFTSGSRTLVFFFACINKWKFWPVKRLLTTWQIVQKNPTFLMAIIMRLVKRNFCMRPISSINGRNKLECLIAARGSTIKGKNKVITGRANRLSAVWLSPRSATWGGPSSSFWCFLSFINSAKH